MRKPQRIRSWLWFLEAAIGAMVFVVTPAAAMSAPIAGTIISVGNDYGNLETDIPVADLATGTGFTFFCRNRTFSATLVNWYSDVAEGAWLGLVNPSGNLQLAINNGDADAVSGCTEGDALKVSFE